MAQIKILIKKGATTLADLDVPIANASLQDIIDAFRKGEQTDTIVAQTLAARWIRDIEQQGYNAALQKRIATAVANATANFAANHELSTDATVALLLAISDAAGLPPPP